MKGDIIMKFMRNNWYYVGGVLFVLLSFGMILFGQGLDTRQLLLIALYMTMLVHQFEEYGCPGGFPMFWNVGTCGEQKLYDRYPMNKRGSAISNLSFWIVYIIAIFLYEIPLLNIMVSYFAFGQLMMHGIMINVKARTKYNPGMASTIILMVPISIYNLWYLASNYAVPSWNWWGAALLLPVCLGALLGFPLTVTKSKESAFRYTDNEMQRFNVLEKLGVK
jgi:hypothetical protein